jgi:uncharacterized paraquat-inducible protein A
MSSPRSKFSQRTTRLRTFLSAIWDKIAAGEVNESGFHTQRICPACHLLTSRSQRCCLECGSVFKPA